MLLSIENEIRSIAGKLLNDGGAELVIGYGEASLDNKTTPLFITDAKDTEKLIYNSSCNIMLAKYLLGYKGKKVGIVAKPCDSRAIVGYILENQLKREDIKIIGVSCSGMDGNNACAECGVRNPVLYDYKVGPDVDTSELVLNEPVSKEIEKLSPEERWEYITREFSKCIKCYACRQACYLCYCNKCFVDRNDPSWPDKGVEQPDVLTYHLIRAMHTAGRCINCGICESACPMGINARLLTAMLYNESKKLYGYEPGMDVDEKPVIADYKMDDCQNKFIE